MKKNNLSTKALSFILSVSLLTTNLPGYFNVRAIIPQSNESEKVTEEELTVKENKVKQAIDNDDVDALQEELSNYRFKIKFNKLRFKYTFDFLKGKNIEVPILHYAVVRKSLKCFKYLLVNGICDPQETVIIPDLDIPLDAIAFAAFANGEYEYEFLFIFDKFGFPSYEENPAVWAAACLDRKHNLIKHLVGIFYDRGVEIPQVCLKAGLFGAVLGNDLYSVKELMKNGANINSTDSGARTLLHLAALSNSTEVANFLIENHIDVGSIDFEQNTPLHLAAESNSAEVADILIKNGANVDSLDIINRTPLIKAAQKDNYAVAELLIKSGADVYWQNMFDGTPLHAAAEVDSVEVADLLLSQGVDPNIISKVRNGATPLHFAASHNSLKVAKLLIDKGANINLKDFEGYFPLHWAATDSNSLDMIKLLISAGANVNEKNPCNGYTPLHCAAIRSDMKIIDLLINSGGIKTLNSPANLYPSPLGMALIKDRIDVMKFLISKGANVNQQYTDLRSILHIAAEHNNFAAVKLLIESGANINVSDAYGQTPLDLATDPKIIALLQENSQSNYKVNSNFKK